MKPAPKNRPGDEEKITYEAAAKSLGWPPRIKFPSAAQLAQIAAGTGIRDPIMAVKTALGLYLEATLAIK